MIKIPYVPGLQGTQINAPAARFEAANAPNAALGGPIAAAIGGVGEYFQGVADQAQKMENARAESEARMQMDAGYSQLQIDLEKDPDPASRINKTRQYFEQSKGIADNPNLSPQARESLQRFHTEFAHKGMIRGAADAAQLSMKRAGLQLNNELDAAVLEGNESRAMEIVDRGVAAGVQLPEQGGAAKVRLQQTLKERAEQKDVIEDPKTWSENNPPDKVPPGTDPARYQQMQDFAKGQMRKKTYEGSANIMDGIVSGQITTEQQIDDLTEDLRPTAVEELKNGLRMRQADGYKEKVASPDYPAQVYGQLTIAIADFKPNADDADARIAMIDRMMRDLKPGFQKDALTKKFKNLESPEVTDDAKNYGEMVLKQVDELNKVGRFGKTEKPQDMTTKDIVDQGFLKDMDKLQRLGFSEGQSTDIQKAAQESSPLGQRKMIELWGERPGGTVNASEIEVATANALRLGHATIPFAADGAVETANITNLETAKKYGIAKMQMEDYLRFNPNAKSAEIDAAFLRITGESIKEDAKRKLVPDRPRSSGETSSRGSYSTGEDGVITPDTQKRVQANARPYLNNPEADLTKAPLGMRNNNPTNIIYPSAKVAARFGAVGKSTNQDSGSTDGKGGKYSQMVFATPEDGMNAGARLALRKYEAGMVSASELIAASNGWTPGNNEAAVNIARTMGLSAGDDMNLDDPVYMAKFLKALVIQEHGSSGKLYKDALYSRAADTAING